MSAYPRVALLDIEEEEVAVRYAGQIVWEDPHGGPWPSQVCAALDRVASGEYPVYAMPDGRTVARIRVRVRFQ